MTVRKIIGALVIVLIGLPVLFGIIWAVGLVRATVSSEFLSDLPRDIIAEIPARAEDVFRLAQDEGAISDPATRAWVQAAAKTGITPSKLLETTGLRAWMEGELEASFRKIGGVFRGEEPLQSISLNFRPLKQALLHPDVDRFLEETVQNLPSCDEAGMKAWQDLAVFAGPGRRLPACRPDAAVAKSVLLEARTRAVEDIDDEVWVFEDVRPLPLFRSGIAKPIRLLSYALFLIPALFIVLGSAIATRSSQGFLRWSGISVLVGSLSALLLALAVKHFSLWAIEGRPFSWHSPWSSELGELLFDKLAWIPARVVDQLFSPVVGVAGVVAVVGVVLVALSYSVRAK
ncbi:MAG: hypothetical protein FJY80_06080 [Candidatus Aminicenantes bacterium]|nr:hypothetical protein [Candidatus Aminicenantes bacterium]